MSAARIWLFFNSRRFERTERFVAEFEEGRRFEGAYSDVISAMLAGTPKQHEGVLRGIQALSDEKASDEDVKAWLRHMSKRLAK